MTARIRGDVPYRAHAARLSASRGDQSAHFILRGTLCLVQQRDDQCSWQLDVLRHVLRFLPEWMAANAPSNSATAFPSHTMLAASVMRARPRRSYCAVKCSSE